MVRLHRPDVALVITIPILQSRFLPETSDTVENIVIMRFTLLYQGKDAEK